MTIRRPLVSIGGSRRQLPEGDVLAGVPVTMPSYLASGLLLRIPLAFDYSLPVVTAAGAILNISVITYG